ncbi:hypothetical protein MMB75_09380 [Paenibacillus sp. P2(2022)]|uniref:hypothetical protein n=1 Tax=Paenibacillus TaxID=44249 RepID=UPI0005ECF972|nr:MULTISPECIES: hypothetical protein [Paenibacillus]AUS25929.1 hypothetical protein C1A50_1754 [Paenibacillus polymyxa]KAE8558256.1 hypothetical protein BJH92_21000 [Paenibacillus polymyxa]KJK32555.1 hypothetical protein TY89_02430 [Paenibacillus polymyxa]MCJ1218866.1 hypothetical protein [Paenibacillus polymyxa]MDG0053879.1 hypothetical protein [Paenibacillus sp. P2(2022)]
MNLILGDKTNELLNMIYEYLSKSNKGQVIWLDGQDIVNELKVNDEINADKTTVKWCYRGMDISPESTTGVLNLLGFLDRSLFNEFTEEDQEYAQAEFTSYLLFALNQFKNVLNPSWGATLSGFCQSLPYQWAFVQQYTQDIQVPRAFFGSMKHVPNDLILGYNTIASDNPFNVLYWKIGVPQTLSHDDHYLWYHRPRGNPFVVTVLDNHMWIQPLHNAIQYSQALEEVSDLCYALMEHFHLRLGEILFFYDEKDKLYIFGSIRPNIDVRYIPSSSIPEFLQLISATLSSPP